MINNIIRGQIQNFGIKFEIFCKIVCLIFASDEKKINTLKLFTLDLGSFYARIFYFRLILHGIFYAAKSSIKNDIAEIQRSYSVQVCGQFDCGRFDVVCKKSKVLKGRVLVSGTLAPKVLPRFITWRDSEGWEKGNALDHQGQLVIGHV